MKQYCGRRELLRVAPASFVRGWGRAPPSRSASKPHGGACPRPYDCKFVSRSRISPELRTPAGRSPYGPDAALYAPACAEGVPGGTCGWRATTSKKRAATTFSIWADKVNTLGRPGAPRNARSIYQLCPSMSGRQSLYIGHAPVLVPPIDLPVYSPWVTPWPRIRSAAPGRRAGRLRRREKRIVAWYDTDDPEKGSPLSVLR